MEYSDHTGLWQSELKPWVPEKIFDAHVHIGRSEDVLAEFSPDRKKLALSTYSSLTRETMDCWHRNLYSGKKISGACVFPFPLQEIDFTRSNHYIIQIMKSDQKMKGFLWTDPRDIHLNREIFKKAEKEKVRFTGVKPYFDMLQKDNFKTNPEEILPKSLLEFINSENLVIMLHTTGKGVGSTEVRNYLNYITDNFKNIKIILAHMGRFICPEDFAQFMHSDLPDNPSVFLETSSAASQEVYEMALSNRVLWDKILFGSDIPFGLISGTEFWSEKSGAIFRTREKYSWSEEGSFGYENLTYNTYHTIKALKDAVSSLRMSCGEENYLKERIFSGNAISLLS